MSKFAAFIKIAIAIVTGVIAFAGWISPDRIANLHLGYLVFLVRSFVPELIVMAVVAILCLIPLRHWKWVGRELFVRIQARALFDRTAPRLVRGKALLVSLVLTASLLGGLLEGGQFVQQRVFFAHRQLLRAYYEEMREHALLAELSFQYDEAITWYEEIANLFPKWVDKPSIAEKAQTVQNVKEYRNLLAKRVAETNPSVEWRDYVMLLIEQLEVDPWNSSARRNLQKEAARYQDFQVAVHALAASLRSGRTEESRRVVDKWQYQLFEPELLDSNSSIARSDRKTSQQMLRLQHIAQRLETDERFESQTLFARILPDIQLALSRNREFARKIDRLEAVQRVLAVEAGDTARRLIDRQMNVDPKPPDVRLANRAVAAYLDGVYGESGDGVTASETQSFDLAQIEGSETNAKFLLVMAKNTVRRNPELAVDCLEKIPDQVYKNPSIASAALQVLGSLENPSFSREKLESKISLLLQYGSSSSDSDASELLNFAFAFASSDEISDLISNALASTQPDGGINEIASALREKAGNHKIKEVRDLLIKRGRRDAKVFPYFASQMFYLGAMADLRAEVATKEIEKLCTYRDDLVETAPEAFLLEIQRRRLAYAVDENIPEILISVAASFAKISVHDDYSGNDWITIFKNLPANSHLPDAVLEAGVAAVKERVKELLSSNNVADASEAIGLVMKWRPDEESNQLRLAVILIQSDEKTFRRTLSACVDRLSPEAAILASNRLSEMGDAIAGLPILTDAIHREPSVVDLRLHRGLILHKIGRHSSAVADFEAVSQFDWDPIDYYKEWIDSTKKLFGKEAIGHRTIMANRLAEWLCSEKATLTFDDRVVVLAEVLRLIPDNPVTLELKGDEYRSADQYEDALKCYELALAGGRTRRCALKAADCASALHQNANFQKFTDKAWAMRDPSITKEKFP